MSKPTFKKIMFKKIKPVSPRGTTTIRFRAHQCLAREDRDVRMLAYGRMVNARRGIHLTRTK